MNKFRMMKPEKHLLFFLCLTLSIFLWGCKKAKEKNSTSAGAGYIKANLVWEEQIPSQEGPGVGSSKFPEPDFSVIPSDVVTIRGQISGPGMETMTTENNVADRTGTLKSVPAGTDRILILLGLDSSKQEIYRGESASITVTGGQTTDAGDVIMKTSDGSAVFDLDAPANPSISINSGATSTSSVLVTLSLSASDNVGVSAWYASESSTAPVASATGWTALTSTGNYSADVNFTLSNTSGTKTVYAWFKDDSGNISDVVSDMITFSGFTETGYVTISGGTFQMGDIQGGGASDESPDHSVTLSSFYIMEREVTAAEYKTCVDASVCSYEGSTDTYYTYNNSGKEDYPINYVSWTDIQDYITWKNQNSSDATFDLCTEAQWEYAARAGTTTKWSCGNVENTCPLRDYAWYTSNNGIAGPKTVKNKTANAWGVYDMHGNVWEWVKDWYSNSYYSSSPTLNPAGPGSGMDRVIRGGNFNNSASELRSARRSRIVPSTRDFGVGFRLCAVL